MFCGRTGSGKTTLARSLLRSCNVPYAVLDPKHRYRDGDVKITRRFQKKLPEQIIRVDPLGGDAELGLWDEVIYDIWKDGDRIIYVDEATLITPPRSVLPELGRAIRTGRERNVAVWVGTQRPKDIPSVVFTEAEHFFLFRLQWEDDRRKVASFTSPNLDDVYENMMREGREAKHDFVYYGVDDDRLIRCRATNLPKETASG
jgi:DNA helicase HerA-like ATPase